jgi:hypothetical protein
LPNQEPQRIVQAIDGFAQRHGMSKRVGCRAWSFGVWE